MKFLIFITAPLLLSCGHKGAKEKAEISKPDTIKTIQVVKDEPLVYTTPDEGAVNEMLKSKFENKWHVLNDMEANWMKDAFDYFIVPKRKAIPNYPYITNGDYNADGKADMAAVVTDSSKNNFRIAILFGKDNIQLWEEDIMIDAALSTIPNSTIEGMDGEKIKKIKLKGDGINVEYFEKASFVLYWDKSSFKRIQTGD